MTHHPIRLTCNACGRSYTADQLIGEHCEPCLAYRRGREDGTAAGIASIVGALAQAATALGLEPSVARAEFDDGCGEAGEPVLVDGPYPLPVRGLNDPTPWLDRSPAEVLAEEQRAWARRMVAAKLEGTTEGIADPGQREAVEQAVRRAKAAA